MIPTPNPPFSGRAGTLLLLLLGPLFPRVSAIIFFPSVILALYPYFAPPCIPSLCFYRSFLRI
jgi:hypothetical protein